MSRITLALGSATELVQPWMSCLIPEPYDQLFSFPFWSWNPNQRPICRVFRSVHFCEGAILWSIYNIFGGQHTENSVCNIDDLTWRQPIKCGKYWFDEETIWLRYRLMSLTSSSASLSVFFSSIWANIPPKMELNSIRAVIASFWRDEKLKCEPPQRCLLGRSWGRLRGLRLWYI